jgi:CRP/FNR family cyclic AMP-dependent transcriptional regulator
LPGQPGIAYFSSVRSLAPPPGVDVAAALAASSLRLLPPSLLEELTGAAPLKTVPARRITHREGDPPFLELVVSGLIRGHVDAPNARTMTIRYCRPGALMGTATLFNPDRPRTHANLTPLVDSCVMVLQPKLVQSLASTEIAVASALLAETSARTSEYISELEATSFASARQRLARHLLDLAAESAAGGQLVARASQEELAEAAGTVREVVVRVLREMREQGLIRTRRGAVEVLDAARLDAETYAGSLAALVRQKSL